MNFLFGLTQGLFPFVFMVLIFIIASRYVEPKFKKTKAYKNIKKGYFGVVGLIFLFVVYSSVNTYGPRVTLDKIALPEPPERVEVVPSDNELIEFKDRIGQFDHSLETEAPSKEIE